MKSKHFSAMSIGAMLFLAGILSLSFAWRSVLRTEGVKTKLGKGESPEQVNHMDLVSDDGIRYRVKGLSSSNIAKIVLKGNPFSFTQYEAIEVTKQELITSLLDSLKNATSESPERQTLDRGNTLTIFLKSFSNQNRTIVFPFRDAGASGSFGVSFVKSLAMIADENAHEFREQVKKMTLRKIIFDESVTITEEKELLTLVQSLKQVDHHAFDYFGSHTHIVLHDNNNKKYDYYLTCYEQKNFTSEEPPVPRLLWQYAQLAQKKWESKRAKIIANTSDQYARQRLHGFRSVLHLGRVQRIVFDYQKNVTDPVEVRRLMEEFEKLDARAFDTSQTNPFYTQVGFHFVDGRTRVCMLTFPNDLKIKPNKNEVLVPEFLKKYVAIK